MRLDNVNKDSVIEKLVSNEIKMFEVRFKDFLNLKVNWGVVCLEVEVF